MTMRAHSGSLVEYYKQRKVVQISGTDNRLFALADDGTIWELNHDGQWGQHDLLPPRKCPEVPEEGETQIHGDIREILGVQSPERYP